MNIAEYKQTIVALRPMLLSIARRIVKNEEDAEDAVQDVCLKIWHNRENLEQYNSVEAYSVTMTKNRCIDQLRSKRINSSEEILYNQSDGSKLPDELLVEKDNYSVIKRIIASLPPLQQHIIQLKDIEGYETSEIIELTGMTPEAIRNNLSRGRKRIREIYVAYQQTKSKEYEGNI